MVLIVSKMLMLKLSVNVVSGSKIWLWIDLSVAYWEISKCLLLWILMKPEIEDREEDNERTCSDDIRS